MKPRHTQYVLIPQAGYTIYIFRLEKYYHADVFTQGQIVDMQSTSSLEMLIARLRLFQYIL